jgi:hypothetical protein
VTVVTHDCDARHIEASRASRREQPERNNVFEEDSSDHNKGNNSSSSRFFSTPLSYSQGKHDASVLGDLSRYCVDGSSWYVRSPPEEQITNDAVNRTSPQATPRFFATAPRVTERQVRAMDQRRLP